MDIKELINDYVNGMKTKDMTKKIQMLNYYYFTNY